jgi:hypothetical protein
MRTQSRIEYISRILSRGGLAVKSAKDGEQKSISHRLFADLSLVQVRIFVYFYSHLFQVRSGRYLCTSAAINTCSI